MKVYVAHSQQLPYQDELYQPIRTSVLNAEYEFVLPHETSQAPYNSLDQAKTFKALIAEVSFPSTGLGIELGWFNALGLPILCLQRAGSQVSPSVQLVATQYVVYDDTNSMLMAIQQFLTDLYK